MFLLVGEIEQKLDSTQWNQRSTLATHDVVDYMSKMRQISPGQCPNLGAVIDGIITSASCISHESNLIHIVVDHTSICRGRALNTGPLRKDAQTYVTTSWRHVTI